MTTPTDPREDRLAVMYPDQHVRDTLRPYTEFDCLKCDCEIEFAGCVDALDFYDNGCHCECHNESAAP